MIEDFMTVSVSDRRIRERKRLLLYSTCLTRSAANLDLVSSFSNDYVSFSVCLESTHMNMVGFKLLGTAIRTGLKEVAALTVDGSPHCIQLHYVLEEVARVLPDLNVRHMVVSKGHVIEINPRTVRNSRYLARLEEECSWYQEDERERHG